MKKLLTPVLLICLALTACGPKKTDLEAFTLNENVNDLTKDRNAKFDELEMLTAFPGYLVEDTKGIRFGTVELYNIGNVEYLMTSRTDKKLAGMIIMFNTDGAVTGINAYLRKKYGKPTKVLEEPTSAAQNNHPNAGQSGGSYLWSNVKPGISMVLMNIIADTKSSRLVILRNDATPPSPLNASTALDRVIQNYTEGPVVY